MKLVDLLNNHPKDLTNFTTIERTCSTLSIAGCTFIAISFLAQREFRVKPINRLVFYASMGNIFTNVATLISRDALSNPKSGLCQFQAFLIQMFMAADAYWTLAMACNVYLTFYRKFDAERLRRLEVLYFILCYGVPFIPGFVYIFTKSSGKGRVYGNATLWCWVSGEWDILRIVTFYAPVWLVILLTMAIYLRAGREIWAQRKHLRNFDGPVQDPLPLINDPFQSMKTTEVFVTSEAVNQSSSENIDLGRLTTTQDNGFPTAPTNPDNAYTITISSSKTPFEKSQKAVGSAQSLDVESGLDRNVTIGSQPSDSQRADFGRNPISSKSSLGIPRINPIRRHAAHQAENAAWSYTKVSVLFFIAMMVTWIPSSANRLYSVVHEGEVSVGLQYAAAFVLPLQGFWNAVIYITNNLNACKSIVDRMRYGKRSSIGPFGGSDRGGFRQNRGKYVETDSMTELHSSRPNTRGTAR
ncbi:G-protein coupled receptor [Bisporella sp. PMI_857]|nr:G-protein coupled receptor [Bisporella sp. PMI_857]